VFPLAKAKAIQIGEGSRSHTKNIAQNPTNPRSRSLIGLDITWVIVAFHFKRETKATLKSHHSGIFTWANYDIFSGRGKSF
jgi:hypothetical protein